MTPAIYFARHGETEWNAIGRVQGGLDSPLTARGRGQARAVGEILRGELGYQPKYRLVASPRGRAMETAGFVSGALGLPIEQDARLAEATLGCWDGLMKADIMARIGAGFEDPSGEAWHFQSPDGERFADVRARASSFLGDVTGNAVIVAHGLLGKILRGVYLGLGELQSLHLTEPQGEVFRMKDGAMSRLSLAGVEA